MKTKVVQCKWLCPQSALAITLFGLVFTRDKRKVTARVRNHELIHCMQQLEWLYIPFFVLYGLEWLINLFKYRESRRAYFEISFEKEAYNNDWNLDYLKHRKLYSNYRHNIS